MKKFDWKIWAKKIGISALEVLLAGGMTLWQQNIYWLALVPVFEGLRNYLKHR